MVQDSLPIAQRLWNYCNVLRDNRMSYEDYVEQMTCLLFLKMADEQTHLPWQAKPSSTPNGLDWQSLLKKDSDALERNCRHILEMLAKKK